MRQYVLGLDNGGTVSKAALFTLDGREIASAARRTDVEVPAPGWAERDMEALWQANCDCIREVLDRSGIRPGEILALSVCGHGKGLYPWGRDGAPARRGIVSTDSRAWRYPRQWRENGVFDRRYPQLCQQLIPAQQAALLAWLKDHERRVYEGIRWAFPVKDYIRFRLTGEAFCEETDLSGSGLMDLRERRVDRALLEDLGIGEALDMLPPVRGACDLCGAVTAQAARRTGLLEGTPVAGGMFDIDACAVAMDLHSPEQLCVVTGTWSINAFLSPAPILNTAVAMNSLFALPGLYLLEECSPTGAGNLDWALRELLGPDERSYDRAGALAQSADFSQEVFFLPFLYGSNAHARAKAAFLGVDSTHTRADLLRAVYEGVAFSHKTHVERLLSVRPAPAAIRMAGGAARSPFWVGLFADVLGYPIETVDGVGELGALGCAMAAAVAAGAYPDLAAAERAMVRVSPAVRPAPERAALYRKKYETYTALCGALDQVWARPTEERSGETWR